jgi:hypothetical protein
MKDRARESGKQLSEFLPQRRKGAMVFKKKLSRLGAFAPSRENDPSPKRLDRRKICLQRANLELTF